MSEHESGWRGALKEQNAIGWLGLMLLVLAIGLGALFFGGGNSDSPVPTTTGSGQIAK